MLLSNRPPLNDPETLIDAEECYSQIVGNALRDVPGPSGKKFIEAYMMTRVRNEWVFAIFSPHGKSVGGLNRSI